MHEVEPSEAENMLGGQSKHGIEQVVVSVPSLLYLPGTQRAAVVLAIKVSAKSSIKATEAFVATS